MRLAGMNVLNRAERANSGVRFSIDLLISLIQAFTDRMNASLSRLTRNCGSYLGALVERRRSRRWQHSKSMAKQ